MDILVIEDQQAKFDAISGVLKSYYGDRKVLIERSETFSNGTKNLYEKKYDLIILDLMLPLRRGDMPVDITAEALSVMEASDKNRGTATVALSGFDNVVEEHRRDFSDAGVLLVRYDENNGAWVDVLKACLQRYVQRSRFDFVVICALEKERDAFNATNADNFDLKNIQGLDCMTMDVGNYSGVCIKLPRMGLVESSIISARAIELFSPKLITMSGICAGVVGKADIGTLIVADMCWEYQAGKWADSGFKIEHYDVDLSVGTRTALNHFAALDKGALGMKTDLTDSLTLRAQPVVFLPMATGSAVIASREMIEGIGEQHRKMAGLDMEMYGVYKAADLSGHDMIVFGAKTVVDLADNAKGDEFHRYGAVLSARFVCGAIQYLLTESDRR